MFLTAVAVALLWLWQASNLPSDEGIASRELTRFWFDLFGWPLLVGIVTTAVCVSMKCKYGIIFSIVIVTLSILGPGMVALIIDGMAGLVFLVGAVLTAVLLAGLLTGAWHAMKYAIGFLRPVSSQFRAQAK